MNSLVSQAPNLNPTQKLVMQQQNSLMLAILASQGKEKDAEEEQSQQQDEQWDAKDTKGDEQKSDSD